MLQQAPVQPTAAPHAQKLVVNVTDNAGRFILGMRPTDFVVEEGGVQQQITGFAEGSDSPISLGILVDKSTSMRLPLYVEGRQYVPAALIAATRIGRALLKAMKPNDEFILMTFDERLQVKQNFTQDRKKIEDQLEKLREVGEATNLYENVASALERMKKSKYKRRAIILITDAYDTSGKQLDDLRPKIAEQEVQVFTCGLRAVFDQVPDPAAEPLFQLVLRAFSVDTGGLSVAVDLPELQDTRMAEALVAFSQILAMELRGQYTLTYNTTQTGPIASRFIRVRSTRPELRVRLRRDTDDAESPKAAK
jgi:VWFA-related protein